MFAVKCEFARKIFHKEALHLVQLHLLPLDPQIGEKKIQNQLVCNRAKHQTGK